MNGEGVRKNVSDLFSMRKVFAKWGRVEYNQLRYQRMVWKAIRIIGKYMR